MTTKQIVLALKKRFWLVLAGAVIAGGVAAVLSLIWPRSYESEALLIMLKLRPNVTLDPRFETVSGENVVNTSVQQEQVRRQTLVGLASSPDLLLRTLDRLADTLSSDERSVERLRSMVDVRTEGNLIAFRARADSPNKAAAVANAWAEVYKEQVNRLYSTISPSDEQIRLQVESAQASYETAKSAVEAFLRQNREGELNRQIDQKKGILADLQATHVAAAKQRESDLLAYINQIDQLLLQAQSLRQQCVSTTPGTLLTAGEQFALFSLEAAAFSQPGNVPVTLEIGQGWPLDQDVTAGQAIEHLDQLVDSVKAAKASAQAELEGLAVDLLGGKELLAYGSGQGGASSIVSLQEQINALEAELERQKTVKQDLIDARDVAQQSHLTLVRKAVEVQILSQLTGVEVELAARAQPPDEPAFPHPLLTTMLGVLAGGLAGLAMALVLEWWPRV